MFDCSPSMMLLYHRPVPAKIPKRRSRAGKHFIIPPAACTSGYRPHKNHQADRCALAYLKVVCTGEYCHEPSSLDPYAYYDIAKRKRRSVTKNDRTVTGASNAD